MKYEGELLVANALPDAPLPMPKQRLERSRSFLSVLRSALAALPWL
jgi:hypothetical protein